MARKRRRLFISVVLVAALLITLVVVLVPGPERIPLPNPNGYDDLVKAGTMVNGDVSDFPHLNREALSQLMPSNREALALGRLGLSRKCRVTPNWLYPTNVPQNLISMRLLVQAFAADGRLANLEGHNDHAVRCYLDTIRLGNESSRGGLLVHSAVGLACRTMGIELLKEIMTNLTCAEMHVAVSGLADINDNLVPWSEVARNERAFDLGRYTQYRNPIRFTAGLIQAHRITVQYGAREKQQRALLRLLIAELAVRCYASEQGHPPESLDSLVPKYIPYVPTDPYSGKPLRYRAQGTNWLVYSAGANKIDDGGRNDDLSLW